MSYYKEMKEVNLELDKWMNKLIKEKGETTMNNIVLNVTRRYEIGPKYVEKRIKMLIEADPRLYFDGELISYQEAKQ